jgi:hypothetical protein
MPHFANMANEKESYAVQFARRGAKARNEKLSPEEKRKIARNAAKARWAKARKGGSSGRT